MIARISRALDAIWCKLSSADDDYLYPSTEEEWLARRNDGWRRLRELRNQIPDIEHFDGDHEERDGIYDDASIANHPEVFDAVDQGWHVLQGATGRRRAVSLLVKNRGMSQIMPPPRATYSPNGANREWTIIRHGEGPVFKDTAVSLREALEVASRRPSPGSMMSEEGRPEDLGWSPAQHERDRLRDLQDPSLWRKVRVV